MQPAEKLAAGRLMARSKVPYFRSALLALVPRETPGLGTIGVSKSGVLFWCPDFIGRQPVEAIAGLFVHEILHLVYKHADRCGAKDKKLYNVAGDLCINPGVRDMGFNLPEGADDGQWPKNYGWDEGLTAEEYYELLREKQEQEGGGGKGECGEDHEHGEGCAGGEGDKPKAGSGYCGSCAGRPLPDEPTDSTGQAQQGEGRSEQELERVRRAVAEAVQEHASKSRGTMPAGLTRWADELLAPPKVPWRALLARAIRQGVGWAAGATDHRYDAPSRRQAGIGYGAGRPILPRLRQPLPLVGVELDSSGSMGYGVGSPLYQAACEVGGIMQALNAEVIYCACDAEAGQVRKVKTWADAAKVTTGGGGTDMAPGMAALLAHKPKPSVIVCITDGYIGEPPPEPIGVRVIWCLVGGNKSFTPGYGQVIEADDDAAA